MITKSLLIINWQIMIGWLSRCWGGLGIATNFQKTRINCVFADWNVPTNQDITYLITSFKGENPQINHQTAFTTFLRCLETDSQRFNDAFILKHLLILDVMVEERVKLHQISSYYNNQILFINRSHSNSTKELITAYYMYIKEKAKNYENQSYQLINRDKRQNLVRSSSTKDILIEVNRCFKIQNSILTISQKYQYGNKSPALIQFIFSSLLKTYLSCYSIVSLGIITLFENIEDLNSHDLQQFSKFLKYYNKDYSQNFLIFIEQNKTIDCFRDFKYNQVISIDEKAYKIIEYQMKLLNFVSEAQKHQNIKILRHPTQLIVQNEQQISPSQKIVLKKKRKEFACDINLKRSALLKDNFHLYNNYYSENFITAEDKPEKKRTFKLQKGESLYDDVKTEVVPSMNRNKFDEHRWNQWQNIYCS